MSHVQSITFGVSLSFGKCDFVHTIIRTQVAFEMGNRTESLTD